MLNISHRISTSQLPVLAKIKSISSVDTRRIATAVSFIFYLKQKSKPTLTLKDNCYTSAIGVCFGGANVLNTVLAGMVESAILFPVLNVSTILLCLVLSIILFKEKLTIKKSAVIILSVITVLAFSF